ncbi:hypothetical protein Tco_0343348 [Tanacetum coccineum]
MLCYLTGMKPYYITCIKDGPFQPKIAEGANKPKAQWSNVERRVVNQDQCLKSIIISCLLDDIMESVISCKTSKDTWTDLDFQENSDDEVDERTSEEYLKHLDIEFHERALLAGTKRDVSDDEEMVQVKMLMALPDDELVERHNRDSKLPNFNTGRILVPEIQAVNESLGLTEAPTDPESSKESESGPQTPLPPMNIYQGASPSLEVMPLT